MYSCAWRGAWTQGDTSSSRQPRARIRSCGPGRTKPARNAENHFHINLISPSAGLTVDTPPLPPPLPVLFGAQIILNYCGKARRGDVTSPSPSVRFKAAAAVQTACLLPPLTFPPRPAPALHAAPQTPTPSTGHGRPALSGPTQLGSTMCTRRIKEEKVMSHFFKKDMNIQRCHAGLG